MFQNEKKKRMVVIIRKTKEISSNFKLMKISKESMGTYSMKLIFWKFQMSFYDLKCLNFLSEAILYLNSRDTIVEICEYIWLEIMAREY